MMQGFWIRFDGDLLRYRDLTRVSFEDALITFVISEDQEFSFTFPEEFTWSLLQDAFEDFVVDLEGDEDGIFPLESYIMRKITEWLEKEKKHVPAN